MIVIVNDDNVRIETVQLGPYGTNAYIVVYQETRDSLVVDAPAKEEHAVFASRPHNPNLCGDVLWLSS